MTGVPLMLLMVHAGSWAVILPPLLPVWALSPAQTVVDLSRPGCADIILRCHASYWLVHTACACPSRVCIGLAPQNAWPALLSALI